MLGLNKVLLSVSVLGSDQGSELVYELDPELGSVLGSILFKTMRMNVLGTSLGSV